MNYLCNCLTIHITLNYLCNCLTIHITSIRERDVISNMRQATCLKDEVLEFQ